MAKFTKRNLKLRNNIIIISCIIIMGVIAFAAIIYNSKENNVSINSGVTEYLEKLNFNKDDYTLEKINDYKTVSIENISVNVTEDEIEEYIKMDLESYEERIEVEREKVQKNDVVNVQYTVECDGVIVNEVDDDSFMVGAGKYNEQIENALIGKNKNEEIIFNIQVPEDDVNDKLAGKTEKITLRIKSLYTIKSCELTEEFVKENYDLNSIDEYYQYVRTILEEQEESQNERQIKIDMLNAVSDCFDLKIDKEKVANYSVDIVNEYKDYAYIEGITLEQYISEVLKMSEDDFYQMCYDEGFEDIKSVVVVGAIAEQEHIHVTEKEIDDWIEENNSSGSERVDVYVYILKSKVEELLCQ